MQELHYALLDGELVSIKEVKNGLKCGCVCPACGAKLIARQGQKVAYHFAHYKAVDCEHGKETALHLLGKKVISKGRVFLPAKPFTGESQGTIRAYNEAIEETFIGTVKPDVLLKSDGEMLGVEIKVHHAVDDDKKYKIYELSLPTIEIDLSDAGDDYTEESVEQIILSGQKTSWVYTPESKRYFLREWFGDSVRTRNMDHVEHCPLDNGNKAYIVGLSKYECHDCGYGNIGGIHIDRIICAGKLKDIDYMAIEKIRSIVKVEGQLKSFDVVINGEEIHQEFEVAVAAEKEEKPHGVQICFADDTICWRCRQKMCSVYGLVNGTPISPDEFSDTMIKISREKGVRLEERGSRMTKETHIVNVCPHCGAFIGEFYLHDLWNEETEVIQVEDTTGLRLYEDSRWK